MRIRRPLAVAAVALVAALPAGAQRAATRTSTRPAVAVAPALAVYQIDATHSELSFRIRHLLGRVSGGFGEWGGTIVVDSANPANSKVDVTIKTASIDTKNAQRDAHLKSNDFFAADSFPTIAFRSTKVEVQGKALKVYGNLTMRGRTRPVVLAGEFSGAFKDPWGKQRAAFTAGTTVNRNDFGVSYNKAVETGMMLGDDVTLDFAIEAVRQ